MRFSQRLHVGERSTWWALSIDRRQGHYLGARRWNENYGEDIGRVVGFQIGSVQISLTFGTCVDD